jgi:hypothetical protein
MRLKQASRLVVAGTAAVGLGAPSGEAASVNVDYAITLAGLPIGTAELTANLDGPRYRTNIQARLTGLAGAVTGGKGAADASGVITSAQPSPNAFAVTARNSNDQRTVRIGMTGGAVRAVSIEPPFIDDKPDRVPVKEAHKRGVLDPVSAILMPVFGRGEPISPATCNRTLPVFDGAARYDIVLSYAQTRQVEKPGYQGPVVVCNARYVPVAGHRPERPATKFMVENRDLSVWLAPVEGTRVLLPVRISVRTMIGTSVVEATRWSLEGSATPTPASARSRRATAE